MERAVPVEPVQRTTVVEGIGWWVLSAFYNTLQRTDG